MAASHSAATFVAQQTFEQDIQSQTSQSSANVVGTSQADFTQAALQHGLPLSSSNPLPQQIQQVTIQQAPIQQTQQLQQQPQIIQAVTAAAAEEFQSGAIKNEGFSTTEVHYVDAEHAAATIYTNGTIAQPSFSYNDNSMFAQQAATTFIENATQQQVYTTSTPSVVQTVGTVPGQQYMQIPSQVTPSHGAIQDVQRHPITHTTRASPATVSLPFQSKQLVQWLLDNYETAEGVSLPRSTLYNHYLQHCQTNKIDAVNAASFGKLIRSVFLGLRTRRLGTRGNSKYHYYGIRIKPSSPLNALTDDSQIAMRQSPAAQKRLKPVTKRESSEDGDEQEEEQTAADQITPANSQAAQHQQYLGDTTQGLPEFDEIEIDDKPLPEGVTEDDVDAFRDLYREHCEAILDVVVNLQFAIVEALWQTFWRTTSSGSSESGDGSTANMIKKDESVESRLPAAKLAKLCDYEPVLKYVKDCDHTLYQSLVEILIPDVLRPIPGSLTQAIRNFAKSLETWLAGSLNGISQAMIDTKISAVSAFSQTLRRYTSLNHLAQAARAVLQNPQQINQMLADLNRVDFANVQEQASWVCGCDDQMVHQLENDFKVTLQQQNSLEQWAEWLENVVNTVLKPHEDKPSYAKAARQFLLKWSFYSSMIIRDLTLRSAASFGSFHLIRLLYDEYMFYLVEHKVASATGATPIAVMGEYVGLGAAMALGLDVLGNSLSLASQISLIDPVPNASQQPYGDSATSRDSNQTSSQQDIRQDLQEPDLKRPRKT